MSAALLRLQLLERRLSDHDRQAVHQASSTMGAAMERLRALIFQLRPLALDYEGLEAAVRTDAARVFDGTPVIPTVRITLVQEPDRECRAAAFRIIHEALANVRQHADASAVRVSVGFEGRGIVVTVVDDGVGFEADEVSTQPGHLGLMSMRERAEAYGGWCEISSEPDRGTEVRFWLPVQMEPQLAVAKQA